MDETRLNIRKRLKEIILDSILTEGKPITDDSRLKDYNADSLDKVELVMNIEDTFHISIPDEEAEKLASVTFREMSELIPMYQVMMKLDGERW